jgi:TrmH family RNA methyltransferase
MKLITSESNATYRSWLKLAAHPRAVREAGRTLAEGWHLAHAALDAGVRPLTIVTRRGADLSADVALAARLDVLDTPRYELAAALYDRIAPVERGAGLMLVLPVSAPPPPHALEADAVFLDGIQDPGNAGALLRVAAAAGITRVFAAPSTSALWAPKVLRGGQGAHFALALHEQVTPAQLREIKAANWVAAAAHDAASLWRVALPEGPIGWVFGSEGQGLSAEAEALCGVRVCIPISPNVESLNVATAAAICLFERRRRAEPRV